MIQVEHGEVKNGGIVFAEPLGLPEGTQVAVAIRPLLGAEEAESVDAAEDSGFDSLPFFGMWSDREEMQDSAAWVRQERERWQQRAARQD